MLYSYSPGFQLSIGLKWLKLSAWGKVNAIDPRRILCTEFGVTGDFNLFQQVSYSAHGVVVTFAATQAPSHGRSFAHELLLDAMTLDQTSLVNYPAAA